MEYKELKEMLENLKLWKTPGITDVIEIPRAMAMALAKLAILGVDACGWISTVDPRNLPEPGRLVLINVKPKFQPQFQKVAAFWKGRGFGCDYWRCPESGANYACAIVTHWMAYDPPEKEAGADD